jgi:hypothetical protein
LVKVPLGAALKVETLMNEGYSHRRRSFWP